MENCVFCDFDKIKSNTLARIRGFNITATLGQITEGGYLLLVPQDHTACLGAFDKKHVELLDKVASNMIQAIQDEYGLGVLIFEHGIVGQTITHAHLHFVPAFVDMTDRVRFDFPDSKVQTIESLFHLVELYTEKPEPYLFWSTPSGDLKVCWNPPAPSMYLRLVVAEMLGVPERGNWRQIDPEQDKVLRNETIDRLSPYFLP